MRHQILCALLLAVASGNPVQNTENIKQIRLEDIENDNLKSEQEAKRNGFRTTIGVTNDINAALGKLLAEQPPKYQYPGPRVDAKVAGSRPFVPSKSDGWIPLTHLQPPSKEAPKSQPYVHQPAPQPYVPPSAPFWNQPLTPVPVLPPQMPYPMAFPYMALPQVFFLQNKGLVTSGLPQQTNDLLAKYPQQQAIAAIPQGILPFARPLDANPSNSNQLPTFISPPTNFHCSTK